MLARPGRRVARAPVIVTLWRVSPTPHVNLANQHPSMTFGLVAYAVCATGT